MSSIVENCRFTPCCRHTWNTVHQDKWLQGTFSLQHCSRTFQHPNVLWLCQLISSLVLACSAPPCQLSEWCCAVFRSLPAVGWLWETRWRKLWWCEASFQSAVQSTGYKTGKYILYCIDRTRTHLSGLTNNPYTETLHYLWAVLISSSSDSSVCLFLTILHGSYCCSLCN